MGAERRPLPAVWEAMSSELHAIHLQLHKVLHEAYAKGETPKHNHSFRALAHLQHGRVVVVAVNCGVFFVLLPVRSQDPGRLHRSPAVNAHSKISGKGESRKCFLMVCGTDKPSEMWLVCWRCSSLALHACLGALYK